MKPQQIGLTTLALLLLGCTTTHLPRGARLVGGGLAIDFEAPALRSLCFGAFSLLSLLSADNASGLS